MRILRIENEEGKGYFAALPSNEKGLKEFFSSIEFGKNTETIKEIFKSMGAAALVDIATPYVSCFRGGNYEAEDFTFNEIQLIQLHFLATISRPDECFESLFYNDHNRYTTKNRIVEKYLLFNDFEFLDRIERKGFKLYYANMNYPKTVLYQTSKDAEVNHHLTFTYKCLWDIAKQPIKPKNEDEVIVNNPFLIYKSIFAGVAKGLKHLRVPEEK